MTERKINRKKENNNEINAHDALFTEHRQC